MHWNQALKPHKIGYAACGEEGIIFGSRTVLETKLLKF